MKKVILILLILIIGAGAGAYYYLPGYLSGTFNSEPVEIEVKSGDNLSTVAEELFGEGVIKSVYWFRYNGQEIATKIKPGKYTIEPGMDIDEIFQLIQKGEQEIPVVVTFPEGYILYQFAQKIEEAGFGSVDEFIETSKILFEERYSDGVDTDDLYFELEGYLFPDTYHFSKKHTIKDIVKILADKMDSVWSEDIESKRIELGLSRHQVLTIASLIEREAYNDSERERISGVIFNRIGLNMPLQIDATVIYGIGLGKEHMTRVLYADLEKYNPFNTYMVNGLPPGPIASPGLASIVAAVNPEQHDYLYYVMGKDGHVFAKTYNEHLKNVEEYRKLQQ
ncbi:MAG: endolytic transglycosylase MltG [Gudongella sp.]|nr:endolytic transglycosylase MltG [Gudongella sp.]